MGRPFPFTSIVKTSVTSSNTMSSVIHCEAIFHLQDSQDIRKVIRNNCYFCDTPVQGYHQEYQHVKDDVLTVSVEYRCNCVMMWIMLRQTEKEWKRIEPRVMAL